MYLTFPHFEFQDLDLHIFAKERILTKEEGFDTNYARKIKVLTQNGQYLSLDLVIIYNFCTKHQKF